MKTNNRVRRNGSAATAALQGKSRIVKHRKNQTPPQPSETITILFYSIKDDEELCRLELDRELYLLVAAAAKKAGQDVGKFIQQGVLEKIRSLESFKGGAR